MTEAKASISLVVSAIATDQAEIITMKTPMSTASTSSPPQWIWKPNPVRDRDSDGVEEEHEGHRGDERPGENREAARRGHPEALDDAGSKLEDRAESLGGAAREREEREDAGKKDVEHRSGRPSSREVLEQRREQHEIEHGRREPDEQPHRIAQLLGEMPLEQQAGVFQDSHAATSEELPVSRNDRPVYRKNTSSNVGSERLIDFSAICSRSSSRRSSGNAALPSST